MKKKLTAIRMAILMRFGVIFILLWVLVLSSINNISDVRATKDETADINLQVDSLNEALSGHQEWAKNILEYFTLGTDFTGSTNYNTCSLGTFISSAAVTGNPDLYSNFLTVAVPAHQRVHEYGNLLLSMDVNKEQVEMANIFLNNIEPDITIVVNAISAQEDLLQQELDRLDSALESDINIAMITNIICTLSVAFVCGTTIFYLNGKVAQPLKQIAEETVKLSHGDLNLKFDRSSDVTEVYALADALTTSVSELARMIWEIDSNVEQLAKKNYTVYPSMTFPGAFKSIEESLGHLIHGVRDTFAEIGMTSNQVATASDQFTVGSQLLADGSTEQAASVEELSATMSAMTENMDDSVTNARSANDLGKNAATMLEQSYSEMNELMTAIREIEESTAAVNNIIKTINDIASQTNILALNAAVEAARAGESGKGFAVVADEVRNLAQKSASAVKSTTELIEQCLEAVNSGAQLATHTNESFSTMSENVTEVIKLITHVASNLEEQSDSLSNFAIGMDQISAVVQTNTATSEETASTSEELNLQVKSLNELVSEFRIKEEAAMMGIGGIDRVL